MKEVGEEALFGDGNGAIAAKSKRDRHFGITCGTSHPSDMSELLAYRFIHGTFGDALKDCSTFH